jgi:hypothetical protein
VCLERFELEMFTGEAIQRGRFHGFASNPLDESPAFPLDADASPRFPLPFNHSYEDEYEVRNSIFAHTCDIMPQIRTGPTPTPICILAFSPFQTQLDCTKQLN